MKINKRYIQDIVLAGKGDEIRKLLLTLQQIELVRMVSAAECITTSQLAEWKKISVQNASSKLNRLYDAGYLSKITVSAPSGGIEHIYRYLPYSKSNLT